MFLKIKDGQKIFFFIFYDYSYSYSHYYYYYYYLCLPVVLHAYLLSLTLRVYPFQFPWNDYRRRMQKCIHTHKHTLNHHYTFCLPNFIFQACPCFIIYTFRSSSTWPSNLTVYIFSSFSFFFVVVLYLHLMMLHDKRVLAHYIPKAQKEYKETKRKRKIQNPIHHHPAASCPICGFVLIFA